MERGTSKDTNSVSREGVRKALGDETHVLRRIQLLLLIMKSKMRKKGIFCDGARKLNPTRKSPVTKNYRKKGQELSFVQGLFDLVTYPQMLVQWKELLVFGRGTTSGTSKHCTARDATTRTHTARRDTQTQRFQPKKA